MKFFVLAATLAALTAVPALAQNSGQNTGQNTGQTTDQPLPAGTDSGLNVPPVTPRPNPPGTMAALAIAPLRGANSFTEGQAQARIAHYGFADVGALKKGRDGVWRGTAMRQGKQVHVWLDYAGNVGEARPGQP
jgi:hypothetical protein